ncbi:MAG: hypothetical protein AAF402_07590 [Pseudomonadota bacterium]
MSERKQHTSVDVMNKIAELYCDLIDHDGFGDLHLQMRILKRGQKEIIIQCGKEYRYVVTPDSGQTSAPTLLKALALNGQT